MRKLSLLMALSLLPSLSGCIAAVLPLAAAGTMGKTQIDRAKAKKELVATGAKEFNHSPSAVKSEKGVGETFNGQGGAIEEVALDDESRKYLSRFLKPIDPNPSPYGDFANYALAQSAKLAAGDGVKSAILIPRVNIFKPQTVSCKAKPLAVLIDLDAESEDQWLNADTLYRQNGLAGSLDALRKAEISVIWLSDQPATAADSVAAVLEDAGFAAADSDDFLFLDRGGEDRKQVRRWDAARSYCIVAVAGDERSDFDELYDYLRSPDGAISLDHMFGNGWFITPPPLIAAPADANITDDQDEG